MVHSKTYVHWHGLFDWMVSRRKNTDCSEDSFIFCKASRSSPSFSHAFSFFLDSEVTDGAPGDQPELEADILSRLLNPSL